MSPVKYFTARLLGRPIDRVDVFVVGARLASTREKCFAAPGNLRLKRPGVYLKKRSRMQSSDFNGGFAMDV